MRRSYAALGRLGTKPSFGSGIHFPSPLQSPTPSSLLCRLPSNLHQHYKCHHERTIATSTKIQQRVAPFSTDANTEETRRDPPTRTNALPSWLDAQRPIETRVRDVLAASTLHPADFHAPAVRQLLKDCCQRNTPEGMKLAQDVLDRLLVGKRALQADHKNVAVVFVPESCFQTVLYGWAVLAASSQWRVEAQNGMRDVLQLAVAEAQEDAGCIAQLAQSHPDKLQERAPYLDGIEPTVNLFNTYLFGLSNLAHALPQAAVDAEAVLFEMSQYHRTHKWHVKPNGKSYALVLTAYANTGHRGSGQRALGLLRRMQQVHEAEKQAYLDEYGVPYSMDPSSGKNKRQIVTPDAAAYTLTMRAIVNSNNPQSPHQAIDLLREAQNAEGVVLDAKLFTAAIKSLARLIEREGNALRRIEAAQQAEEMLKLMEEYSQTKEFSTTDDDDESSQQDNIQVEPQDLLVGYNACLDAWSRAYCREAAPHCESILWRMAKDDSVSVKANTISFNSCLYAWSRAHKFHKDAAKRAEKLLKRQIKTCREGILGDDAKPDFQSYTICILAQADANDRLKLYRAVKLLDTLVSEAAAGQMAVTRNPNAPFSALLSVIARSPPGSRINKPKPGENEEDETTGPIHSIIELETDCLSIATKVYSLVLDDTFGIGTHADHHLMSAYLRCIATHCPPDSAERGATAKRVFEDACQAGEVSRLVMKALAEALEGTSEQHMVRDLQAQGRRPNSWIRNVPAAFR